MSSEESTDTARTQSPLPGLIMVSNSSATACADHSIPADSTPCPTYAAIGYCTYGNNQVDHNYAVVQVRGYCQKSCGLCSLGQETAADRRPLEAVFRAANGESWTHREGWMSDSHICWWFGVSCDDHARVNGLILGRNRLTGTLSDDVRPLQNLQYMLVYRNDLHGSAPPVLPPGLQCTWL